MSATFHQLTLALNGAQGHQLDAIAKAVWVHHGAGALSDEHAQALAESIQVQRSLGVPRRLGDVVRRIATGSAPRRPEHVGRRRTWAAAGWLPPKVAAGLTPSHTAVMAVIAREVFERHRCKLCNAALAALAGVSVSTVKAAKRAAVKAGLIVVYERRVSRDRSLSTVIKIASPEWSSWLATKAERRGGVKFVAASVQASNQRTTGRRSIRPKGRFAVPLRRPSPPPEAPQGAFGERGRS